MLFYFFGKEIHMRIVELNGVNLYSIYLKAPILSYTKFELFIVFILI